jgi:hypothetical protein
LEPNIFAFLKRIINTMAYVLLWLAINSTAGIMYGWGFVETSFGLGNAIFYVWLVTSFCFLRLLLKKMWRKPLHFEH